MLTGPRISAMLAPYLGPMIGFWFRNFEADRGPNAGHSYAAQWSRAGLDRLAFEPLSVTVTQLGTDERAGDVVVRVTSTGRNPRRAAVVRVYTTVTIGCDGSVGLKTSFDVAPWVPALPRVGLRLKVPKVSR